MGLIWGNGASQGVHVNISDEEIGATLGAWARDQLAGGIDGGLVMFCLVIALGDLLSDGEVDLPDLRGMNSPFIWQKIRRSGENCICF